MGVMEHGTRNTYLTHRCRCEACRAANAAYMRARYQARADVRAYDIARTLEQRRAAGVRPAVAAMDPAMQRQRNREHARQAWALMSEDEREEARAERRAKLAEATAEQREHRLALQRERNARYLAKQEAEARWAALYGAGW